MLNFLGIKEMYCKLCDAEDFYKPWFKEIHLELFNSPQPNKIHRKRWEYVVLIKGLKASGYLRKNYYYKILDLGAGKEILVPFLTRYGHVYAVDKYYPFSSWKEAAFFDSELYNIYGGNYDRSRLTSRYLDMRFLDYYPESFDIIVSSCSIEHLDSRDEVVALIADVEKLLKVGGIFAFTTEFVVHGPSVERPGSIFLDEGFLNELLQNLKLIELLWPFSNYQSNHPFNKAVDGEKIEHPHINIYVSAFGTATVFTSAAFFFRKVKQGNYDLKKPIHLPPPEAVRPEISRILQQYLREKYPILNIIIKHIYKAKTFLSKIAKWTSLKS